jgi:hypothetical protein
MSSSADRDPHRQQLSRLVQAQARLRRADRHVAQDLERRVVRLLRAVRSLGPIDRGGRPA